ncbi:AsmA family protein [Leeia oryzae]|uniref:AsmA family protein n=1 Tax=Leeia oryzae TaxID=356662 RepID=UPI000372640E|nr:AsmA family protein [Leeia oryzae]
MQLLKKVGLGVAGVAGVAVIGATGFLLTFNPNDYKPQLVDWVKTNKQRTLAINGNISLTVYPQIGLKVSDVTLSEHASSEQFAKVGELQVGVQLMPLFSKKVIVDSVDISGLQVSVKRDKQGQFNFADFMEKSATPEQGGSKVELKVAKVALKDSAVSWHDAMTDRALTLDKLNVLATDIDPERGATLKADGQLATGPLAQPTAQAEGAFTVATAVTMDKATGQIDAKQLVTTFEGAAAGQQGLKAGFDGNVTVLKDQVSVQPLKLTVNQTAKEQQVAAVIGAEQFALVGGLVKAQKLAVNADLAQGGNKVKLDVQVPAVAVEQGKVNAGNVVLSADLNGNGNTASIKGQLNGVALAGNLLTVKQLSSKIHGQFGDKQVNTTVASPLQVNLADQHVQLSALKTQGQIQLKGMPASVWQLAGSVDAAIKAQVVSARLNGKLDASNLSLQADVKQFANPTFKAKLDLDALDVDRYVAKAPASTATTTAPVDGNAALIPDLPIFHKLSGVADVHIGHLHRAPWDVNDVTVHFEAQPGQWHVDPVAGKLLQGQVKAAVNAKWGATPVITVAPQVDGLALGELLKVLSGDDKISGKTDVSGQLSFSGRTLNAIKQSLGGNVKVKVSNGAIKGISMIDTVQKAQTSINTLREKAKSGASATAKTEFSDLNASFQIANGIAKNSDLSMVAPLLKASGKGQFNIPASGIDYNVLAGVEYKKDAGSLGGINVPVHVGGTFTQPVFTVDYASVAKQILQNQLNVDTKAAQEKAKAALAAQQDKLKQDVQAQKDQLKTQSQDQLKNKLKGLFGK